MLSINQLRKLFNRGKPASGGLFIDKILLDIEENGWQDDARVTALLNDNRAAIDLFKKAVY